MARRPEAWGWRTAANAFLMIMIVALPATLSAQAYPRGGSFEVGGGAVWIGESALGAATATETRNQPGAADRLTLFEADARLRSTGGVSARIGFNVTPTIGLEGGLIYSRPAIVTAISTDFEGALDLTLDESSLQQYFVEFGLVWHMIGLRFSSRSVPFLSANIGYLRQLTEGRVVAETGRVYQIGGGLKQMLSANRRVGLRIDVRLGVKDGGFSLGDPRRRPFPLVGGSAFVVF